MGLIVIGLSVLPTVVNYARDFEQLARLTGAYDFVVNNKGQSGSVSDRVELAEITLDVIIKYPYTGVGLGGWGKAVEFKPEMQARLAKLTDGEYRYPHNMILEILSEAGWFLGGIGMLPFLYFLFRWRQPFMVLPLFYLLTQMVSGDLQDGRFIVVFSIAMLRIDVLKNKSA